MPLKSRLVESLRKIDALERGSSFLIACSGGLDSIAATYLFAALARDWDLRIGCMYIHHGLREEADEELTFVRETAASLNCEFYSTTVDVAAEARINATSIQNAARYLRYDALERVREQHKFDWIVTAHHADDQAETMVAKFLQGAGILGLEGVRPKWERVIRPLLFVTKEELRTYAANLNLDWREDASNTSRKYLRNAIRLDLMPEIKELVNPGVASTLGDTAREFRMISSFLREHIAGIEGKVARRDGDSWRASLTELRKLSAGEQLLLFQTVLTTLTGEAPGHTILIGLLSLLVKEPGSVYTLQAGFEAKLEQGDLLLRKLEMQPDEFEYAWDSSDVLEAGWFRLSASELSPKNVTFNDSPTVEFIDLGISGKDFYVRNWRQGDAFVPLGMSGTKLVSDFFTDLKIPTHERGKVPILLAGEHIVWLCGLRLDDRFKVTKDTVRAMRLTFEQQAPQ
ncbi:MAG: tRNA lysidine(34) synthetase TilS [Ectothiorhodospiraceae bacterium]|nr:tRNA lysidine(34) synthetase TilS [Ectothiorhodospiraceae bacterium]